MQKSHTDYYSSPPASKGEVTIGAQMFSTRALWKIEMGMTQGGGWEMNGAEEYVQHEEREMHEMWRRVMKGKERQAEREEGSE